MKFKEIQREKGITLIALLITIIVLLILAGISIAMLTGQNGILTQAQNSKQATKKAEVKEKAQTDIVGVQTATQSTEISKIALKGILNKYFENVPDDIKSDTELITKAEYGNIKMKVSDIYSGKIVERYMASDIANASQEDKQNLYGATVTGYTCTNSAGVNTWKIFYADNKNIYLIADDYIKYDYCPGSVNQKIQKNSTEYQLSMNNVINDYKGTESITDDDIKALNNDYFSKNYSSTNNNMKAVAYMLDKNVWSVYAGDKAEYAIGGPTIELLFKSYNEKYGTSYVAGTTGDAGYRIKKQKSDNYSTGIDGLLTKSDNTQDQLYVINSTLKASAMFIASPANFVADSVMLVRYGGSVDSSSSISDTFGFRPLVCLKSNTQLQKVGDTIYQIK